MRRTWYLPLFALLLAAAPGFTALASQTGAVQTAPDTLQGYAALIGAFPQPGSDGAKADVAILLWLQRTRSPGQVSRADNEVVLHLGIFSEVTGKDLTSGPFPLTRALSEDLQKAVRQITAPLKEKFGRPRPYNAFPQIKPAIPLETSHSYPSGHATWGMAQATLLAALEPHRKEAILERGRLVGYDRVIGGVHYPSDVEAGQLLGPAIAQAWLAHPTQQKRLEAARAEWQ
jgi:acid phosphatase (class A)